MTVLLRVSDLRLERGQRTVLDGLSFELDAGIIWGLVGPNGVGKTSLLEVLVGRLRPQSGEFLWRGAVWPWSWDLARRARLGLGYLAQGASVFRRLSVWENLRAVPGRSDAELLAVAERVGLAQKLDAQAGRLSGGERRRLELGRLWAMRSALLLCDEPFAGLDPHGVASICALLGELAAEGAAVLVTDHRVELLGSMCTRLAVLLDGRIAAEGSPDALRADDFLRQRYFGG